MSFAASAWAWKVTGLGHSAKLILLALAECSSAEDETCYPSANWLAERCEVSRATVFRAIDQLEARNLVARFPIYVNNEATSNTYLLNVQGLNEERWTWFCKAFEKSIRRGEVRRRETPVQTVLRFEPPGELMPERRSLPYPEPRDEYERIRNAEFIAEWRAERKPDPGEKQPGYRKRNQRGSA